MNFHSPVFVVPEPRQLGLVASALPLLFVHAGHDVWHPPASQAHRQPRFQRAPTPAALRPRLLHPDRGTGRLRRAVETRWLQVDADGDDALSEGRVLRDSQAVVSRRETLELSQARLQSHRRHAALPRTLHRRRRHEVRPSASIRVSQWRALARRFREALDRRFGRRRRNQQFVVSGVRPQELQGPEDHTHLLEGPRASQPAH